MVHHPIRGKLLHVSLKSSENADANSAKIAQLVQNGWKENVVLANAFETVQSHLNDILMKIERKDAGEQYFELTSQEIGELIRHFENG